MMHVWCAHIWCILGVFASYVSVYCVCTHDVCVVCTHSVCFVYVNHFLKFFLYCRKIYSSLFTIFFRIYGSLNIDLNIELNFNINYRDSIFKKL